MGDTYTDLSICDYHLSEWNTVKENKKDQSNLTSIFLEELFEKGIKNLSQNLKMRELTQKFNNIRIA
ncbi:hypothetical protein [Leptospira interrogans]|uniref:hypothetical protein n=1 Tax=Leptospira interrogans TaxID=173 RepID=UPI000773688B|nr:hypothetical protein [Leptospira interrogans]